MPPKTSSVTWPLGDRTWTTASNGWGPVERNKSNGESSDGDGRPIRLNGTTFTKGLGVHAPSDVRFTLDGKCSSFLATVGVDDESGSAGSVTFQVWTDGMQRYDSGLMTSMTASKPISVDLTGANELQLVVTDGADGVTSDHGDWADARVVCDSTNANPPPYSTSTWRGLGLVVRNTDVTFKDPLTGRDRHVTTTLTATEESGALNALRAAPKLIDDWSAGHGRTSMDILVVNDTISSVERIKDEQYQNSFWVSPANVTKLLAKYAPMGHYDSVYLVWDPDGTTDKVPVCCTWGQGRDPNTNGATFASLITKKQGDWGNTYQGEAIVHEWLHGAAAYYHERGFNTPDPDDRTPYGFKDIDPHYRWRPWYNGLLSGTLVHETTKVRAGFDENVWKSGTPTHPAGTQLDRLRRPCLQRPRNAGSVQGA